jgi:hypothetical protein
MKRTYLIGTLVIGLVLGLSVMAGVAWYFMRAQDSAPEYEPGVGGATRASGGNNARAAKFAELDTDQDGALTPAEFGVGRKPAEAAKWFERRDVDHDGFISRDEFLPFSAMPKNARN